MASAAGAGGLSVRHAWEEAAAASTRRPALRGLRLRRPRCGARRTAHPLSAAPRRSAAFTVIGRTDPDVSRITGLGSGADFSYPLYPYYGYGYPNGDSSSAADTQAASAAPADDPLVGQVQALTDEVDEMRAEQAANERDLAFAAPPAIPEPKPASTILVFRDGHQMEVQNYAVMGAMVWVLGDQTTRKVALAELDMDVTRKLNADRGVEFTGSASR